MCHWQVLPWATNAYNKALKIMNWAHLVGKKLSETKYKINKRTVKYDTSRIILIY